MITLINLILGATALLGLILILYLIEKHLNTKLKINESDKNYDYSNKIELLKKSTKTPKEKLKILNLLSRSYFKDAFDLKLQLSYSELADEFKEKGNYEESRFCKYMDKLTYSPEKLTPEQINLLIGSFKLLTQRTRIPLLTKRYVRNSSAPLIEEEEKEDKDFFKQEWNKLKIEIHHNRNKVENLLNQLNADKKLLKLVYNDFNSQEKINRFFIENSLEFKKSINILAQQKELYAKTKELIKRLYQNITPTQKEDLETSVKIWTRDIIHIIKKEKNPLKQQMEILNIIKKCLIQLEFYN